MLINIFSKKNAFVRVITLTIRHFETGLFKKCAKICTRLPRGMKSANIHISSNVELRICQIYNLFYTKQDLLAKDFLHPALSTSILFIDF